MMEAKSNRPYLVTAFGGRHYPIDEWRPVPAGCEEEARNNPYLDTREYSEPTKPVELDATDAAVGLALEYNLDLSTVEGTGADGRILKSDVQKVLDSYDPLDEE